MLRVEKSRIRLETRTLKAVIAGGVITSLVSKLDGRTYLRQRKGAPAMELAFCGGEVLPLGTEAGDRVTNLRINDTRAEVRIEGWHGDGVITFSEDTASGDILVEPGGCTSRPGLRACRWTLGGVGRELELVAPFWQGVHLPLEDPLIRNTFWNWPQSWEAGLAILQGEGGGLWVHCRDDRYRYKNLLVGRADDARRLGFETEAYGPLDDNLSAGGLTWRINVYRGGWKRPAGAYRRWLEEAYDLRDAARADWLADLRLALSWCPCDADILKALAKRLGPRTVLLHVPRWRKDPYDVNYPTYRAGAKGRRFVRQARAMGFRVMPHFNAIDMDPTHPTYALVRDFQYRDAADGRVQGWVWHGGGTRQVPESNAGRLRHQDKKTMVKIHPALSIWRSILTENVAEAVKDLDLDVVFLDVSMNTWNLRRCLVEAVTPTEGIKRLIADIGAIKQGLVVGGEGRNEIVMQGESVAQVHLFKSSGRENIDGLERTGRTPVCEYLFGRWCRSFGYSHLGGESPEAELRMKLHVDLGAIPTVTVRSARQVSEACPAMEKLLSKAAR